MSGQQIATSQFSSFIARTRKKLSDWRTKSFGTTSASLKRAFSFYGLLIALILSAMALIAYETFRSPSVVFDPISVPQRLNELGHTSQTVVNRLREEIEVLRQSLTPKTETENLVLRHSNVDIVIAPMGISIKAVADYLRELIGSPHNSISGEMILNDEQNSVQMRLRYNETIVFEESNGTTRDGIAELIRNSAPAVMEGFEPQNLAFYYLEKALEATDEKVKQGHYREIHRLLNVVYSEYERGEKQYVQAINVEGAMYITQKRYEEAIEEFERAIAIDPSNDGVYSNWGAALARQNRFEDAIEKYEIAANINSDVATTHLNWGIALYNMQNYAGAIERLSIAADMGAHPYLHSVHLSLGRALELSGDLERAIEHYNEAIRINREPLVVHCLLGRATQGVNLNKTNASRLELLRKRSSIDPDSADCARHIRPSSQ